MKRVFQFSSVAVVMTALYGCASTSNSHHYAKLAGQEGPVTMPAKVALKDNRQYYPIDHPVDSKISQPSLVPPDTDFKRYRKRSVKTQPKTVVSSGKIAHSRWSSADGNAVLLMTEAQKKAWHHVGEALHSSNYQVLDQDPSLSSYYILDTSVTGKQITEKTPIYRVYVKPQHANGSMVVLMSENNAVVQNSVVKRILGELQQHLV